MPQNKQPLFIFQVFVFFCTAMLGQVQAAESLGAVAQNALVPTSMIASALYGICYIIGAGFFFGGMLQFKERRINKQAAPLSRAVTLTVLGILIFLLPFITKGSISAP